MAFGDAIGGGLSGAASGAMIGSAIPGIGTAIGAGVGGLAGLLGGWFGGPSETPERQVQVERYTPEQKALMAQLGQQGAAGLQGILNNPLDTSALENEMMRRYNQDIIPDLLNRLGSSPTAGLQRNSAMGQQLGAAGTDLASRLGALRAEIAQQQQGLRANIYGNMLGQGLGQTFDTIYRPEQQHPGFMQSVMPSVLQGATQYGLSSLGGLGQQGGGFGVGSGLGGGQQAEQNLLRGMSGQQRYNFETPMKYGAAFPAGRMA